MNTVCRRLQLERYAGGELDDTERAEVQRHLDECSGCSSFIAQLEAERTEFLRRHPFSSFMADCAPVNEVKPWYRDLLSSALKPALVPVYVTVILLLVYAPLRRSIMDRDVRFKGVNTISFLYERGSTVREGSADLRFLPNDRIQIMYSLPRQRYISLLSIDSRGTVSFYHPDSGAEFCSVIAEAGNRKTFPGSIVLDDTPGDELVVALFSDSPLRTTEVFAWAKREFNECPDPDGLRNRMKSEEKVLGADIATLLLHKE